MSWLNRKRKKQDKSIKHKDKPVEYIWRSEIKFFHLYEAPWKLEIYFGPRKPKLDLYGHPIEGFIHNMWFPTAEEAIEYRDSFGEEFATWCQYLKDIQTTIEVVHTIG